MKLSALGAAAYAKASSPRVGTSQVVLAGGAVPIPVRRRHPGALRSRSRMFSWLGLCGRRRSARARPHERSRAMFYEWVPARQRAGARKRLPDLGRSRRPMARESPTRPHALTAGNPPFCPLSRAPRRLPPHPATPIQAQPQEFQNTAIPTKPSSCASRARPKTPPPAPAHETIRPVSARNSLRRKH